MENYYLSIYYIPDTIQRCEHESFLRPYSVIEIDEVTSTPNYWHYYYNIEDKHYCWASISSGTI